MVGRCRAVSGRCSHISFDIINSTALRLPMVDKTNSKNPSFTEYGIPIRNLWHMMLYAWNELPDNSFVTSGEIESAPTLDALFALMLTRSMQQRLRTGLGHGYVSEAKILRGLRGRVNFSESLKDHSFEKGEANCNYQLYSANEPRNQIILSTISKLIQTGQFGPHPVEADALRHRLRWLVRSLDGIDRIELTPALIARHLSLQNDRDYRLMLSICELILQRQMPLEDPGSRPVPGFDREALILYRIYERFVANFYRIHLRDWEVSAQKRLDWHAEETNEHLPAMIPDLVLQERKTGRLIVLDTKFTTGSLVENQWGKPVYDSSHLYQMYAYLRSQEQISEAHRTASGILLYPAAQYGFSEKIQLPEHQIRMECVDLAVPWQKVESQLLEIVLNQ
jgi:5-methylcytosine-specific restriction enzyme subunit McrC